MNKIVVGILAHVDAGKTTLSEAMLYTCGAIKKLGRVDTSDSFLDNTELERKRGITIFSKQAILELPKTQITLLDTPGHVDFSAEMERTLQVLDTAILVISGADGVQGHTKTLWNLLKRYHIPTFLFINKMDQQGTDREALLKEVSQNLSHGCIDFSDTNNSSFFENIAMSDEELLDEFINTGSILSDNIKAAISSRKIFPCFFGSALKLTGVKEFLLGMEEYAECPKYNEIFGAKVYKIARDEQGNRLTYMKITGGNLEVRSFVNDEKVTQIRIYSGSKYCMVKEVTAGTICAVTGLINSHPGEGIGKEVSSKEPILEPILSYRIGFPDNVDVAVVLCKLKQIEEEEPQLHIIYHEKCKEIHAQIMGEVQVEILQSIILERYGIKVNFMEGSILYKETIANMVEGVGHFEPLRHYAEVHLKMEPLEPGSGLQFAVECGEDVLDKNWQRLILTHLEEKEHVGVLTGSPITDMQITLISGRAHQKHTEGGDFRQATYRAIRQGLMQAKSKLLEPYYEYCLEVPEDMVGRAMSDINKMQGEFILTQTQNGITTLIGKAPVATMRGYVCDVTAYTKGHGKLNCILKGYEPCHNEEEVLEDIAYDPESDLENPVGSVFCAHGAGFVVPWNQVENYMHISFCLQIEKEENSTFQNNKSVIKKSKVSDSIDLKEIEDILRRTYYANKKDSYISHKGISSKNMRKKEISKVSGSAKTVEYRPIDKKDTYLLVDGYNVIFAWEDLKELAEINIDGARGKLMDILCNYQAIKGCNLILVFDAYRIQGQKTEILEYHNIHVVYTKEAETADQFIEHFAHENGKKFAITVATSDGLEQIIIRGQGCQLISSREFEKEIETTFEAFRKQYL